MTTYDPIGAPTLVEVATLRVRIEDLEAALAAEHKAYSQLLAHNQENVAALDAERKAREEAERTVGQLTIARDAATRTAARRTDRAEAAEQRVKELELREIGRAGKLLLAEQCLAQVEEALRAIKVLHEDRFLTMHEKEPEMAVVAIRALLRLKGEYK